MTENFHLDWQVRVNIALDGLSARERVDVLTLAWLCNASNARTEALITPGGFPEERARQVDRLARMHALVSTDEPDLETERLYQEGVETGDMSGWRQRVRGLLGRRDEQGGA